ncbi:MAG: type III polyketide synthase [Phycisphaerales bacterium]
MTAHLHAIGTATPAHATTQAAASDAAIATRDYAPSDARALAAMYRRTGIRARAATIHDERLGNGHPMGFMRRATDGLDRGPGTAERMRAYELCAPDLAADASREALIASRLGAAEITHLVTVSCTGNTSPGIDHALVDALGLSPAVARTHVGFMGCHGAINGLRVARAFAESDPDAAVLLACVELCSLHYYYGDEADKQVANALFADGAASAVIRGGGALTGVDVLDTASLVIPGTREEMGWVVRDHGFEMTLSRRVPEIIERDAGAWVRKWLGSHGLAVEGVGSWAIHPGGPKILHAAQRSLGLSDEALAPSRSVLEAHGNMSSPTVLFILRNLIASGAPLPCVALAFGPGLVIEAALLGRTGAA